MEIRLTDEVFETVGDAPGAAEATDLLLEVPADAAASVALTDLLLEVPADHAASVALTDLLLEVVMKVEDYPISSLFDGEAILLEAITCVMAVADFFPCPWGLQATAEGPFTAQVSVTMDGDTWVLYRQGASVENRIDWELDMIAYAWRACFRSDAPPPGTRIEGRLIPLWKGT